MPDRCRFAPSTTGRAHPGTLAAALLCWLDARSHGAHFTLRLEDLDPERSKPALLDHMLHDLAWFGLDWDDVAVQSKGTAHHEAALDHLAAQNRLYPCACTRSQIRAANLPAPDGGWRYPNTCRGRSLPVDGWRACRETLRVRLPDHEFNAIDEGGSILKQHPGLQMGDPIVQRRDGAITYQLAVVVDDARGGITRIVRGRDIVPSTATQVSLQHLLGLPTPHYRHHLLLLEPHGDKLAKLHGAVGVDALRLHYDSDSLCGFLAHCIGLVPEAGIRISPAQLLETFRWEHVSRADRVVSWDGTRLSIRT